MVPFRTPVGWKGIVEERCVGGQTNPEQLARTAAAFAGIESARSEHKQWRDHICKAATTVKLWQPPNEAVIRGIGWIAKIAPDGCDLSPIIQSIEASFTGQMSPKDWCEAIAVALPPFITQDERAVKEHFRVQATAGQFLQIVAQAGASGRFVELLKYMQPSAERGEIINLLANQATTGNWNEVGRKTVECLLQIDDSWDWKPLIDNLQARIQTTAQTLQPDVPKALNTLFDLSDQIQEARGALRSTAQSGPLFEQFHHLLQARLQAAAGICVLAILASDIQLQPGSQPLGQRDAQRWHISQGKRALWAFLQNPNSNQPLVGALSSICTPWETPDEWRQIAKRNPERANLIGQMLKLRPQNSEAAP